jgi:hypothetical protein
MSCALHPLLTVLLVLAGRGTAVCYQSLSRIMILLFFGMAKAASIFVSLFYIIGKRITMLVFRLMALLERVIEVCT